MNLFYSLFFFYSSKNLFMLSCTLVYFSYCDADCKVLRPENSTETEKEKELMKRIEPLKVLKFEAKDLVDPANYSYKVRICDKVEGQDDGVAAVQYSNKSSHILGKYDNADIMGGTDWILLTYYGGDLYHQHCNGSERVTKIMIVCNPDVLRGKFEILEERKSHKSVCYYLFELGSNVACSYAPKTSHLQHKLSSGSVFCIMFFTIVSVYLIIGFLYKRVIVGAKGLEQIPNYSFWKDFGNLQADGCDYFCRCGPRQESQAYRGIDDHLKMDEERDDQLLNM